MAIDYSSRSYWEDRLNKERDEGFEWLVPTPTILPILASVLEGISGRHDAPLNVLHFGCGSSSLGIEIMRQHGKRVLVYDADYACTGTKPSTKPASLANPTFINMDVLSLESLCSSAPSTGWDILVDKSTADAISCGPSIDINDSQPQQVGRRRKRDPIHVLCYNLSQVTRVGGLWISVSYSATRYDFLSDGAVPFWRVVERVPLQLAPTTTASDHVVYQAPTGIWAWVLERIA